jgi:hypothetical protein
VTPAASASEQYPAARDRAHKRRSFDVARRHRGRTILGSDVVLLSILDGQIYIYKYIMSLFRSILAEQSQTAGVPRKATVSVDPTHTLSLQGDKPARAIG